MVGGGDEGGRGEACKSIQHRDLKTVLLFQTENLRVDFISSLSLTDPALGASLGSGNLSGD